MKKLTENQINFLLYNFFILEKYAGWRNIAIKLLETGKCIVAGNECIWKGGVGNFIKVKEAKDAYNCLEYSFDLDYFKTSGYYKDVYKQHINKIREEMHEIQAKFEELEEL